jgi:hypothetical protein
LSEAAIAEHGDIVWSAGRSVAGVIEPALQAAEIRCSTECPPEQVESLNDPIPACGKS